MKKFNSILAIAAVALTSVFGFTSCDKNDDAFNQPVNPFGTTNPIPNPNPAPNPGAPTPDADPKPDPKPDNTPATYTPDFNKLEMLGTWEYTDGDGKTYVLNVTEETTDANDSYRSYNATITVDGAEYAGVIKKGVFRSDVKSTTNSQYNLYNLMFNLGASKSTSTELFAGMNCEGHTITMDAVFKKVSGAQSESKQGKQFTLYGQNSPIITRK